MSSLAEKARACFALAKSSTFEGERQNAIERGLALLERGGLDPDDFDIPGRERAKQEDRLSWQDAPGFGGLSSAATQRFYEFHRNTTREDKFQAARETFEAERAVHCDHGIPIAYPCHECRGAHG